MPRSFGEKREANSAPKGLQFVPTLQQIARRFGYGRRWSREALDRLREEITPMLQDDEWVGERS